MASRTERNATVVLSLQKEGGELTMGHLHDLGLMEGVAMGDASLHHLYLELLLVDIAV